MKDNSNRKIISIQKDHLVFMGEKIYPPFKLDIVQTILGNARIVHPSGNIKKTFCVWDEIGIHGWLNDQCTEIEAFGICIAHHERNLPNGIYDGCIKIGTKDYRECKWKFDDYFAQEIKKGCFLIVTLLPEQLSAVPEEFKDTAMYLSGIIEIDYVPPKVKKPSKYNLSKLSEPILEFSNFNFKLAVIQSLMYDKCILKPKFDIYEFAEEYTKRKINIDDEGYEPIKEALNWFKKLEIPQSMAKEIDTLIMDGGNEIYGQITPFWDGEDNLFDIDTLDEDEVKQFSNLSHVRLMSAKPDKAKAVLEECGVSVDIL